jgi:2-oxo-4-hydroxy-4-carboxy-5-ureidoimidazoline decarboxylase
VTSEHVEPVAGLSLADFNTAPAETLAPSLRACLDITTWVDDVLAARPFPDRDALSRFALETAERIEWPEVAAALDRHPRIGQRPAGGASGAPDGRPGPAAPGAAGQTRTEAAWSASEQSGVRDDQRSAFAAANEAYEQRFGHLFLICAAGLSGEQMLAALRERLEHDPEQERPVVVHELGRIAVLRLAKVVA